MKKLTFNTSIEVYSDVSELNETDASLLLAAKEAVEKAYAPYSKFKVGAAVLLENGKTILGSNQENAAYPLCLCAERVALFSAATQFPNIAVKAIAISAQSHNKQLSIPVPPCGSCRQAIYESEYRGKSPVRLIIQGEIGEIYCLDTIKDLLPLTFNADFL